jgi:glucosamine-6-phosphate deaminase
MSSTLTSLEKVPSEVFYDAQQASVAAAGAIAKLIREKAAAGKNCVLGLATGSTPLGVYNELVRLHQQDGLSFKNVVTFNLDEYYPMQRHELQSYWRFMHENLFDLIDIPKAQVHIPNGEVCPEKVAEASAEYEKDIARAGGIDLQLLGIGRTGHIGFNEPGSSAASRTRMIYLDKVTRRDAASDFFGEQHVPQRALTMGVGTIMESRRVILLAFGEHKAGVIARATEGQISASVAASYLQQHPDARLYLDEAAAAELTRFKCPWTLTSVQWTEPVIRKAVIWLAQLLEKPILKLTDEDYSEHGLEELLATHGPAYNTNINVFRDLQETITGWPGGKPDKLKRPGDIPRATDRIFPKRVVVFSPHPDDDVISMGGTLIRLADQGHEVHVAYQTSGNIAVFDADAIRFADFATEFNSIFAIDVEQAKKVEKHLEQFLKNKKPGQVDSEETLKIKTAIRQGEARAAGRFCGLPVTNTHFLDMPFYETGKVRKKPLSEKDICIIVDLLRRIKPHQIYAAGDLSDPHGTHRVCLAAVLQALKVVENDPWFKDAEVWLYRGAWQEWEPEKIDMAVPLSPDEVSRKREAIFKHQSQKDRALFPGADDREFWQRAEHRNKVTAKLYDKLGLAEYEAMEAFVRWVAAKA